MSNQKTSTPTKTETDKIKRDIRIRVSGYIAGGLGLVAGLAWNDAIKSAIEFLFPLQKNTLLAKFSYALTMTVLVVLISTYTIKFLGGKK